MVTSVILEKFADIVSTPDEKISLVEAALLIACNEYPELDVSDYLQRFNHMTDELHERVIGCRSTEDIVLALNEYLFDELAFTGNLSNFNDPKNSFLNDVLDRKLGIPISLSVIYIELGRRIGLSVSGVSFPGHFLVKISMTEGELVIDPFSKGVSLGEKELEERLEQISKSQKGNWTLSEMLKPASNKQILSRMLRNLKNIYLETEAYERALDMVNFALLIFPGEAAEIRDRAFIYDQMNCYRAAIEDYQDYLMLTPAGGDTVYVKTRLAELKHSARRLH